MSWFLAILAVAALVVIHELGHFAAAKAVGLRVERFSLFFGPVLFSFRRGETEYALSSIPLGGYVRVTGQDPRVELPPELRSRGYFAQPVWRRLVFIAAGPAANALAAFVIAWAAIYTYGIFQPSSTVAAQGLTAPAAQHLRPGDRVMSVDGHSGSVDAMGAAIASHHCAGVPTNGCAATTPVRFVVRRDGRTLRFEITPRYDSRYQRTRVGLEFSVVNQGVSAGSAASMTASQLWQLTKASVHAITHVFSASGRKQLNGIVGGVYLTQQAINSSAEQALLLIAEISLALGIANLIPILPLDGGHILWASLEKLRGRPISYQVMERAAVVGLVLIIGLAYVGLSNDVSELGNGKLHLH